MDPIKLCVFQADVLLPLGGCMVCVTGWKEEQEREYASLVAAVLAICFLKDSGRPLFKNSLRALNCSSSWEFSEPSRLLSSKMEITADAFRAATLEPEKMRMQQPLVEVSEDIKMIKSEQGFRVGLSTWGSLGLFARWRGFAQDII